MQADAGEALGWVRDGGHPDGNPGEENSDAGFYPCCLFLIPSSADIHKL